MEAYDILQAVESNTEARVLATVIHVEGHAYRKQGAVMLLMADGSTVGSISPGWKGISLLTCQACGNRKAANG